MDFSSYNNGYLLEFNILGLLIDILVTQVNMKYNYKRLKNIFNNIDNKAGTYIVKIKKEK